MKRGIVVGGGVVGLSVAQRLLLRTGAAITIMDAPAPAAGLAHPCAPRHSGILPSTGAASWGNAGHIATEQVEPLASWPVIRSAPRRLFTAGGALGLPLSQINRWLPFACQMAAASHPTRVEHGRAALRSLLAGALPAWRSLSTDVGAPALVRETGHYVVWESKATAAAGLASWRAADIGTARFHECDADELRQLAAIMKHSPAGAIRFENTAQIADLPRLGAALRDSIVALNGRILQTKVRAVSHQPGSVRVISEDGASLDADFVVIAAGVRSRELMEPFCRSVPLIAERGYHLQMTDHGWPDLPPVVFEDRSMIVTRFESGLRAASFVEFGSPDAPPDRRKWQRLRQHIEALGLPCKAQGREWMGARPTLPDYLPAIGQLPDAPNILYAFGHQHLGLTLAAITSELVAQLATQSPTSVSLSPFDIQRFSRRA